MANKIKRFVYTNFETIMAITIAIMVGVAFCYAFLWGFDHSPTVIKYHREEVKANWGE